MPESHTGANGVDSTWDQLVSSHFEILDGDIQKLVTVNGNANGALLAGLTWAISREVFEDLCKDEARRSVRRTYWRYTLTCNFLLRDLHRSSCTIRFARADWQQPSHEVIDQPDQAELDKKLEIALENAIRQANQAHESSHPGETSFPGGSLCPGGDRAPEGRIFYNSQSQPLQAQEYTATWSSNDMYLRRQNSHPRVMFVRDGTNFPGGAKGWEYYNSQRQWVDCNPSQTKATNQLESSDQKGDETFDDLHGDHPPAHARGGHSPSQRTQF